MYAFNRFGQYKYGEFVGVQASSGAHDVGAQVLGVRGSVEGTKPVKLIAQKGKQRVSSDSQRKHPRLKPKRPG